MRKSFVIALLLVSGLEMPAKAQRRILPGRPPLRQSEAPAAATPATVPVETAPAAPAATVPAAEPPAAVSRDAAPNPEEQAIRQVVDRVIKAYDAHNAKLLAELFTTDAEIVDAAGQWLQGRAAIEQVFAAAFKAHPKAKIEIKIDSIRFLAPTVAMEEGISTVTHEPGEPGEPSRYTVLHVKQDGKWQMASARDLENNEVTATHELERLAWLVGEWVDESAEAVVKTSYRWTESHKFILSDFTIHIRGKPALVGSQRIGWDPLAKQIRSWVFDSEGGFSEGLWTRDKNKWTVKLSGVTRDGRVGSSTNVYTRLGADRFSFDSHDRVVGGELAEPTEKFIVVRAPPKPR